jgi:magnesium transporter
MKQRRQQHWIDIEGPVSQTDWQALAVEFNLHPVELEQLKRIQQRPRIDFYTNHLTLSVKMLRLVNRHIDAETVTFILGQGSLVTIQAGKVGDVFDPIRQELANPNSQASVLGADYLLYRVLAVIINHYFIVLEHLDEEVERLEDRLVDHTDQAAAHRLYQTKRELITVRKAIWPLREVVLSIERTPSAFIKTDTQIYFRDIYEQTIQVIDTIESLRDLMSSMIEIYLSSLNNRLNGVIKVLTIITTIFMPLTLITGIFGMNFQYLPGLESHLGPWEVMGAMLLIVIAMIAAFKWKRWI